MSMVSPRTRIMLKFLVPQRRKPDRAHAIPERDRDLSGKTIVFTGGTDGLGRAAAAMLYEMGATLVLLARNETKGQAVVRALSAAGGRGSVELERCDLSSMPSVRDCAARVLAKYDHIDVLINCAGVHLRERTETTEGFEANWAVNYLGPFLLTSLLLGRMRASAPSRIVNLTTDTDWLDRFDFDDLQSERTFDATDAYTRGKLAMSMFTHHLGETLEGTGVTVNCLNPGFIRSNLLRDQEGLMALAAPVMRSLASPTVVGADRIVRLAASSEYRDVTGAFVFEDDIRSPHREAQDPAKRERLMQVSEAALSRWMGARLEEGDHA